MLQKRKMKMFQEKLSSSGRTIGQTGVWRKPMAGFTLIELLVVISIIGILASVVLVSLNSARSKSRDAKRLADVRQIMTALELYYNDNSGYPAAGGARGGPGSGGTVPFSTYLVQYPSYPTPSGPVPCADNTEYTYTQLGSGTGYSIAFCLEGIAGGLAAGDHTATQSGLQ